MSQMFSKEGCLTRLHPSLLLCSALLQSVLGFPLSKLRLCVLLSSSWVSVSMK